MSLKAEQFVGKRFCRLLVVKQAPSRDKRTRWWCLCDCGVQKEMSSKNLLNGHTRSCGCLQREKVRANKCRKGLRPSNWKGIGDMSSSHWKRICWCARVRGLEISITHQYCVDLFQAQQGKCALSGQQIKFTDIGDETRSTGTASLDRIDSSKGYIPGNVQWVDKRIQRMKSNFPQNEFIELCRMVSDFQKTFPKSVCQNTQNKTLEV